MLLLLAKAKPTTGGKSAPGGGNIWGRGCICQIWSYGLLPLAAGGETS